MCGCRPGVRAGNCPCGCKHSLPPAVPAAPKPDIDFTYRAWSSSNGDSGYRDFRLAMDGRSLVVIDPEDFEQVERLAQARSDAGCAGEAWGLVPGWHDDLIERMQAALRSLITPPRPIEPTGLGAVVEDARGERWVRGPLHNSWRWLKVDAPGCENYAEIDVVRVLSEGVTS